MYEGIWTASCTGVLITAMELRSRHGSETLIKIINKERLVTRCLVKTESKRDLNFKLQFDKQASSSMKHKKTSLG